MTHVFRLMPGTGPCSQFEVLSWPECRSGPLVAPPTGGRRQIGDRYMAARIFRSNIRDLSAAVGSPRPARTSPAHAQAPRTAERTAGRGPPRRPQRDWWQIREQFRERQRASSWRHLVGPGFGARPDRRASRPVCRLRNAQWWATVASYGYGAVRPARDECRQPAATGSHEVALGKDRLSPRRAWEAAVSCRLLQRAVSGNGGTTANRRRRTQVGALMEQPRVARCRDAGRR